MPEIVKYKAEYASDMAEAFVKIMKWFGKRHGKTDIRQGDFLEEEHSEHIQQVLIFIFCFFGGQS